MAGIRALQRRVKRIEDARRPRPSPFDADYGSFEGFADATYAEVEAGKLAGEFLHILDALRAWALAHAR